MNPSSKPPCHMALEPNSTNGLRGFPLVASLPNFQLEALLKASRNKDVPPVMSLTICEINRGASGQAGHLSLERIEKRRSPAELQVALQCRKSWRTTLRTRDQDNDRGSIIGGNAEAGDLCNTSRQENYPMQINLPRNRLSFCDCDHASVLWLA